MKYVLLLLILITSCTDSAPPMELTGIDAENIIIEESPDEPIEQSPEVEEIQETMVNSSMLLPNRTHFPGWRMILDTEKEPGTWSEEEQRKSQERGFSNGHYRAFERGYLEDGEVVHFSISTYSIDGAREVFLDLQDESTKRTRVMDTKIGNMSLFYYEEEEIEGVGEIRRYILAFVYDEVYVRITCGSKDTGKSEAGCIANARIIEENIERLKY